MSLTGAQLLTGLSNFIDDDWASTTTSAGAADGTTLIDTLLRRYGDQALRDWFLRPSSGTAGNLYLIRAITSFADGTGTCTVAPAFPAQVASADGYGLHEYDPRRKFAALDSAIIALTGVLPQIIYNETITLDGVSSEFAIPSTVRKGPIVVQIEEPLSVDAGWNFLTNPRGDTTTSWTVGGAGASAATYTGGDFDLLIPKYDATCMSVTVPATTVTTHRQTVSAMSADVTAAKAAQRRMTFGMWVYCRTASRVRVEIVDDSGQVAQSGTHQGLGWELLSVTGTISAGNATTLTVGLTASSGVAIKVFWNRAWFFFGDQMPSYYPESTTFFVRRDDTTQRIILPGRLQGKRQLRLIGGGVLSTLGTTAATQVTNTVEVDANSAEVLYAKAAQILLGNEALTSVRYAEVAGRIRVAEARLDELRRAWANSLGDTPRIRGPYG